MAPRINGCNRVAHFASMFLIIFSAEPHRPHRWSRDRPCSANVRPRRNRDDRLSRRRGGPHLRIADTARAAIPLVVGILAWRGLYLRDSRIRELVPFRRPARVRVRRD